MRFLIDRCAGRRLAEWLRTEGHDVLESQSLGPDPGDLALLETAERQDRILVTLDQDFATLVWLHGISHAGLLRLPDVPAGERIRLVRIVLERHAGDLREKAVITVRGDRIRVSPNRPTGS
jgi:predicted nuclease of predicted toxin-antitoxin system